MCDSLIFIFQERIQKILPGIHGVYTPYRGHLYGVNRSSLKQRDIEIGVKNVAFSLYIDCGLKFACWVRLAVGLFTTLEPVQDMEN